MNLSIDVPMTPRAFAKYVPDSIPSRLERHRNMMSKYGDEIEQSANLNNIPQALLVGILMIENEDANASFVNYTQATGLGQIKPLTAMDMLYLAGKKKILTPEKKAIFRKKMGAKLDAVLNSSGSSSGLQAAISKSAMVNILKDPEFNTLLSGVILSLLITEYSSKGSLRVDYVSALYNQGYYALSAGKISRSLSIDGLLASNLKSEGKNYILKMCGKNGWLQILS